jgi:hypothetical protein
VFSVRGPWREDVREYGNANSVQLSVGDSHGKFVVEEEMKLACEDITGSLKNLCVLYYSDVGSV